MNDRYLSTDWNQVAEELWAHGFARLGTLLSSQECGLLKNAYANPGLFRSRIDMARFRFGQGEYQYFALPLPAIVAELRSRLYSALVPIANQWMAALHSNINFPDSHDEFLSLCKDNGQTKPTPLLLRYREGDFNCLHQDLYGTIFFPFQVIICLSKQGKDYEGGELLLVEQRPRSQSMGRAITLEQGEGGVITTRFRPIRKSNGFSRTIMRHGVSPILKGERFTLGLVFHDAA